MSIATRVVLVAAAVLTLSGCADSAEPAAGPASGPPRHAAEERGRFLADCLNEKGFPTTIQEDGSLLSEAPADQHSQRQAAGSECMDKALELYPMPEETDDFKRTLYAAELETTACLESHGLQTEPAPSIQTYLATFSGPDRWSAWGNVTPDTQPKLFSGDDLTELRELEADCPNPLSLY